MSSFACYRVVTKQKSGEGGFTVAGGGPGDDASLREDYLNQKGERAAMFFISRYFIDIHTFHVQFQRSAWRRHINAARDGVIT